MIKMLQTKFFGLIVWEVFMEQVKILGVSVVIGQTTYPSRASHISARSLRRRKHEDNMGIDVSCCLL